MAEMAVSFAIDQLLPLLNNEANLLKSVHKEFEDIKDELESIQAFLKDADRRAKDAARRAAAEGDNINEGVKTWVKQVREAAFRIEDIIDEYMVHVGRQPRDPGCAALLCKIAHLIKTLIPRHQIASEIHDIKSSVREIKKRSERYRFQPSFGQESSSFGGNQNAKWHDLQMASLDMEESEVVGFEAPRDRLIDWLVKGKEERTVISIVGMGGLGKTTLAKKVYDSKEVIGHFDSRVWITVSQSYNAEELLRDMLSKFSKQRGCSPPEGISLIEAVKNCLHQKRYVVVFDDVWNIHFWDEIAFALIDVKNGSRIFITTRNMDVVESCKISSFVKVHELEPLSDEQALELFNKKVFRFEFGGCCPKELINISSKIVKKCKGLPLAIVVIGGLLCIKEKTTVVWQNFSENLNSELTSDSRLIGIKEILGFSYHDLFSYLKPCLLYFGIYPEDYEVKPKRLIRQWIAEGFVKEKREKTLEEVAEGYLTELIHRSLVQVSSISIDGRAKGCRVHDLLRVMILEKFEDLCFCQHISEDGLSSLSGTIRRLSIATTSNDSNDLMTSLARSRVRSLLFFTDSEKLPDHFVRRITTKYKLLKVLDFQNTFFDYIPENLGNLLLLKYLSLKDTGIESLPKSIGMLQNLETLDLRGTGVREMPKETKKLKKLRHLLGNSLSLNQLEDGIGGMTSLQTLWNVDLDGDAMGKLIRELGKLKQLRKLGLLEVRGEHGMFISSSINEMQHLEKLVIESKLESFLHLNSSPPMLRNLTLFGKLEQQKLPEWISGLQNLVELRLMYSFLTDDPLKSLQNLQNLLSLSVSKDAYLGESLHFQDGGFQKLRELYLEDLPAVSSIIIDKGALNSLKKLELRSISHLKILPTGIRYLEKLEDLSIANMSEFWRSIDPFSPDGGKAHWVVEHVPRVTFTDVGSPTIFF